MFDYRDHFKGCKRNLAVHAQRKLDRGGRDRKPTEGARNETDT